MSDISQNNNIMVSIVCNTYNHELYIKNAIDSFLMQKTNFSFEILIHDDASTDETQKIIREYEALYPDLIKPIYQTENQHSKRISITRNFQIPRARGKYIAFCEGDDYWTDDQKLQKQYDALELNESIDLCSHKAVKVKDNIIIGEISPSNKDCILKTNEVISNGGGYVATNSLMFRKKVFNSTPSFINLKFFDYSMQILGSLSGGILYLSEPMSAYRIMSNGSWSQRMAQDPQKRVEHIDKVIQMLKALNDDTNFVYEKEINNRLICLEYKKLSLLNDYKGIVKRTHIMQQLPFKEKIVVLIKSLIK